MEFNWWATEEGIGVSVVVPGKPVESTLLGWEDFGKVMHDAFADRERELRGELSI